MLTLKLEITLWWVLASLPGLFWNLAPLFTVISLSRFGQSVWQSGLPSGIQQVHQKCDLPDLYIPWETWNTQSHLNILCICLSFSQIWWWEGEKFFSLSCYPSLVPGFPKIEIKRKLLKISRRILSSLCLRRREATQQKGRSHKMTHRLAFFGYFYKLGTWWHWCGRGRGTARGDWAGGGARQGSEVKPRPRPWGAYVAARLLAGSHRSYHLHCSI